MAELAELGFTSMQETNLGFTAYVEEAYFNKEALDQLRGRYDELLPFDYKIETVERENWNEEWEKNFSPIAVGKQCRVRATFHEPDPSFDIEIVITPKMSFGTGHHQTTYLMMQQVLNLDLADCLVTDVGCGTGILGILALRLGAKSVFSFDIDDWAVENARENFNLNGFEHARVEKGQISALQDVPESDIVLANINRNVLISEIPSYCQYLKKPGFLILSGFYSHDVDAISNVALDAGLALETKAEKDNWDCLVFTSGS